jgi:hypothetical protein
MIMDEVMEQVRSFLNDPLEIFVDSDVTQLYTDQDILDRVPSALRYLRSLGVSMDAVLTIDAALDPEPTERQGVLLAARIAAALLRGELTRRLLNGDFGLTFRMGNDLIDTKTAAIKFADVSTNIDTEFQVLLVLELAAENEVFGGPFSPGQ